MTIEKSINLIIHVMVNKAQRFTLNTNEAKNRKAKRVILHSYLSMRMTWQRWRWSIPAGPGLRKRI